MRALEEPQTIFEKLKQLPRYHTTGVEMDRTKLSIINSFWAKDAPRLQREFYPAGIKKDKDGLDIYGLGFILEILAEKSSCTSMDPNSEKGGLVAKELLGMLASGERRYGIHGLQSNPDILWLKIVRNHIKITGIGEVKTSLTAFRRKPWQVVRQELAVRKLVSVLQKYHTSGATEDIFEQKRVTIQEQMRKIIVVPAGEKNKFSTYLPEGWECEEIEFSYEEILFLSSSMWPEFKTNGQAEEVVAITPDQEITEEQKPKSPPDAFLKSFWEWGKSILWSVFRTEARDLNSTFNNLLFFCLLTQKIPIIEEDIDLVFQQIEDYRKFLNMRVEALSIQKLSPWEKRFLDKFLAVHKESHFAEKMDAVELQDQILIFLTRIRKAREVFIPDHRLNEDNLEELDVTLL